MKTDRKLLLAILVLIGLVMWLIILSINRNTELNKAIRTIQEIQSTPIPKAVNGENGKTPILGVDYFVTNGKDSTVPGPKGDSIKGDHGESAYDIAVRKGFVGSEDQWIESLKPKDAKPVAELLVDCIDGLIGKKYINDAFWQTTDIKCETTK